MLSSTVWPWNNKVIWKVLPMPFLAIWSGLKPVMLLPLNLMVPLLGRRNPVTRLKIVLLPAPLGPTSPTISPGWSSISIPSTALFPPKLLPRLVISISANGRCSLFLLFKEFLSHAYQACREEEYHCEQQCPHYQGPRPGYVHQILVKYRIEGRT